MWMDGVYEKIHILIVHLIEANQAQTSTGTCICLFYNLSSIFPIALAMNVTH